MMRDSRFYPAVLGSLLGLLLLVVPALALQPDEVLLVANRAVLASGELASYYQQQRNIPAENLLYVNMPVTETCSRMQYQRQLVEPLRAFLFENPQRIRCLLLFYGLPLRVAAPEPPPDGLAHNQEFAWWVEKQSGGGLFSQLHERLQRTVDKSGRGEQGAAVDSELTLLLNQDYPLENWLPNPYFVAYRNNKKILPFNKDQVLMVSRLDAASPDIVRRMIDESLQVEKTGLTGRAYFDARWPLPEERQLQGYALYDASLHKAAQLVDKISCLPVVLDQREALMQPGTAPDAVLYSGWYSLAKYVDAFDWQPGAIGYHIASSECATLKQADSQVWCKRLLEDGVAATIGPVAEPYVHAFPPPELFFGFLLDGYYSLVESYFLTTPLLSWQMVLLGDPLYRPFRNSVSPHKAPEAD